MHRIMGQPLRLGMFGWALSLALAYSIGGALGARDRLALAFLTSTQLPLVLAITALATASGHMRPSTAAALVGAAVLSTLVFPNRGLAPARRPRRGARAARGERRRRARTGWLAKSAWER